MMDAELRSRPMTQLKPGRRLGGAWMAEFIGQRKSVSLCSECERKYGDWHTRCDYHARERLELTDCDGCGEVLKLCKGYYSRLM